jgi:hypothetical protein
MRDAGKFSWSKGSERQLKVVLIKIFWVGPSDVATLPPASAMHPTPISKLSYRTQ